MFRRFSGALAAIMMTTTPALADTAYPSKPVHLIVPFTAGGSTDILARVLAKDWSKMGQARRRREPPWWFDRHWLSAVVSAPADGYTLMLGSDITYAINPYVMDKMPFDPLKDLAAVTRIASAPNWLVVAGDSKLKTFDDLVAQAKLPGKGLSISVNAVNGYAHLVLNGWIKRNGLNISIIPYSGVSKAIPDLLGGHLDGVVDVVGGTIGFVKDGKLRALSILQSKPSSIANGTLPFGGNAVQDLSVTTSFVLLTKTGTPPEVIERIYQGVRT